MLQRGPKVFTLEVGGREEVVSVDRLKPYLGGEAVSPAVPPRRGRPPSNSVASSPAVDDLEARGGSVEAEDGNP